MAKYAVVELNKEITSLVPSTWLRKNQKNCLYPPHSFEFHQSNHSTPENNWITYTVSKIFCWTDTLANSEEIQNLIGEPPRKKTRAAPKPTINYDELANADNYSATHVKIEIEEDELIEYNRNEMTSNDRNFTEKSKSNSKDESHHNDNSISISTIYKMMQKTQQQNQMILNMLTTVQEDVEKIRSQQQLFETQIKRRLTNISTTVSNLEIANQTLTTQHVNQHKVNDIEEQSNDDRETPASMYLSQPRSNNYYSESSLIPEVVHEISNSCETNMKNPIEPEEYDVDMNMDSLNSILVPDEKYGSLGRFPIATVDDYHRFEKKLSDAEFFEAMKYKIYYLVMNFSEKRKTYYEYYRTALKLMFPIKIMHQLTMAPFNHRICFGRSKTCTMVEQSAEGLDTDEVLHPNQRRDELKIAFKKLKDCNRRKSEIKNLSHVGS